MKNRKKPKSVLYIRVGSADQASDYPKRTDAVFTKQSQKKKRTTEVENLLRDRICPNITHWGGKMPKITGLEKFLK